MSVDPVRDTAVGVLLRVFEEGAYLDLALDKTLRRGNLSHRGRRFLAQLAYGTVRRKRLCDYVLERLVREPVDKLPPAIFAILRMGVFQSLYCSQVTFPSMVHTSVDLAKRRGHAGTARLVNAVLRRAPQTLDDIRFPSREDDLAEFLGIYYSMPRWLVEVWITEFGPEKAEALCVASNEEAPVTLRTNTLKTTPSRLMADLTKAGCVLEKRTPVPEELTLVGGDPPSRSKFFQSGHFFQQDVASMLPPHLLEPKPGDRVLDCCAAPGGKTTHIAQLTEGRSWITAMDIHPFRFRLIRENIARLGVEGITLVCGDACNPPLTPGFARVLVDAPCSGLGTLRRHPDLKWRLVPNDCEELARLQTALLRKAIQLCKNGGLIVYSVCTISRAETSGVAAAILETEHVQPEDGPEWLNQWKIGQGQYQTLPTNGGLDGFFLMRLRKAS